MQRIVDSVDAQRCRARRTAHGWVESWSRGQKSQLASRACSGGVSAVMGTSDFAAHTFAQQGWFAIGVKAHCPLRQNLRQWKRRAYGIKQRSRLSMNYFYQLSRSSTSAPEATSASIFCPGRQPLDQISRHFVFRPLRSNPQKAITLPRSCLISSAPGKSL